MKLYKRYIVSLLLLTLISLIFGCKQKKEIPTIIDGPYKNPSVSVTERVDDLLSKMTLEEKLGQMIQAERTSASPNDVKKYYLGSILSGGGSAPASNTPEGWYSMTKAYQDAATSTRLGIPIMYGIDAVHGHNTVSGAVVFPHNIGLGAAGDAELMSRVAAVTAEELIATGINWNFGPTVAVARDERWGRTYESFSENIDLVTKLSIPYITAFQDRYKLAATAKHYVGDGATTWGTGTGEFIMDQGDARISEEELRRIHLPVYEEAVKAGVKTIMVSFSSWNGLKLHEHKYLIQDVLKKELNFEGFVVSDWQGIHQINKPSLYDQVVAAINAGIDMFMEPIIWKDVLSELHIAVNNGDISKERIDDAVSRILKVKFQLGLFEEPLGDSTLISSEFGSEEHRSVAREAVRKSLVLLKNDNNILPLKKDAKIFVTGPAADNLGVQCGGWTITWQGLADNRGNFIKGTTILEGFKKYAEANGGEIITAPERASEASVAVAVIGEIPYAEGVGDSDELTLTGKTALSGNLEALEKAKKSGLPIVVILVTGRPLVITDEIEDLDALLSAWLPGTEGHGVAEVLYGDYEFSGKLSFTWPISLDQLPINEDDLSGKTPLFPFGYGLKMKE